MSNDIAVTVSRDEAGNVLVTLLDPKGQCLAGATFPPELWYQLRGALIAVEEQMQARGWIEPDTYDLSPIGDEGAPTWN
jgi:hypothetical protein